MSLELVAKAIKTKNLNSSEKLLLIVISNHCDDDGCTRYPVSKFREDCGWGSKVTYSKHIKALRHVGLVSITPQATTTQGRETNLTKIIKSKLEFGASKAEIISAREAVKRAKSFKSTITGQSHRARLSRGVSTVNVLSNKNNDLTSISTITVHNIEKHPSQEKDFCNDRLNHHSKPEVDLRTECNSILEKLDDQNIVLPSGLVVGGVREN